MSRHPANKCNFACYFPHSHSFPGHEYRWGLALDLTDKSKNSQSQLLIHYACLVQCLYHYRCCQFDQPINLTSLMKIGPKMFGSFLGYFLDLKMQPKKQSTLCRRVQWPHSEQGSYSDVARPPPLSQVFSSRFCGTCHGKQPSGFLMLLMLDPHSEGPALHYFLTHNPTKDDHQIQHIKFQKISIWFCSYKTD